MRRSFEKMIALLVFVLGMPSVPAEEWTQWRGEDRANLSPSKNLLKAWESEPKLGWKFDGLGRGYAAVSLKDGELFTMGDIDGDQFVVCLDVRDLDSQPKEKWRTTIAHVGDVDYPGPRCTPTIIGNRIFALTTASDLACLDRKSGKIIWSKNLTKDFGGRMMSGWGFSESPLVDGDKVVVTPGSNEAALIALDVKTGDPIWKAAVPDTRGSAYSSCVISDAAGVRQYITLLGRGLVSVSADDGKLLWTYDKIANQTANIPTPIVRGDYVFASTGYGAGAALVKVVAQGSDVKAEEIYFLDNNVFQNHHGGMVLVGDHLFAGTGHNQGFPVCVEFMTGKIAWRQKRGPGQGSAAITYVDGNLIFRYQDGRVALIEASTEKYKLHGTFEIPNVSQPSWPPPVVVDGRLFLREQGTLYCYDLRNN